MASSSSEKERYARLRRVFRDVTYMGAPYLEPLTNNVPSKSADSSAIKKRSESRDSVNCRGSKSAGHALLYCASDYDSDNHSDIDDVLTRGRRTRTPRHGGAFRRSKLRRSHRGKKVKRPEEESPIPPTPHRTQASRQRTGRSPLPPTPHRGQAPRTASKLTRRPRAGRKRTGGIARDIDDEDQGGTKSGLALDLTEDEDDEEAAPPSEQRVRHRRGRSRIRRNRSRGLYKRNIPSLRNLTETSLYSSKPASRESSIAPSSRESSLPGTPRSSGDVTDVSGRGRTRSRQKEESIDRKQQRGWELPPIRVNQTPLPVLPKKHDCTTADHLEDIRKQVSVTLGEYYSSVRKSQVENAKQGWDALLPKDIPTKTLRHAFSNAFWTYSPQSGNDVMMKPWLPMDGSRYRQQVIRH